VRSGTESSFHTTSSDRLRSLKMGCASSKAAHAETAQPDDRKEPEEANQKQERDQEEEVNQKQENDQEEASEKQQHSVKEDSPQEDSPAVEQAFYVQAAIYGPPGSNKSNLCEQLTKPTSDGGLGLRHFTIGEVQRLAMRGHATLGPKVKEAMAAKFNKDKGAKGGNKSAGPSEELNAQILAWVLESQKPDNGWILDGYPTTPEQLRTLKEEGIDIRHAVIVETKDEDLIR